MNFLRFALLVSASVVTVVYDRSLVILLKCYYPWYFGADPQRRNDKFGRTILSVLGFGRGFQCWIHDEKRSLKRKAPPPKKKDKKQNKGAFSVGDRFLLYGFQKVFWGVAITSLEHLLSNYALLLLKHMINIAQFWYRHSFAPREELIVFAYQIWKPQFLSVVQSPFIQTRQKLRQFLSENVFWNGCITVTLSLMITFLACIIFVSVIMVIWLFTTTWFAVSLAWLIMPSLKKSWRPGWVTVQFTW